MIHELIIKPKAKQVGEIRQIRIRRFPYIVGFVVEVSQIYVLAFIHGHRGPKSWQERSGD